MAPPQLLVSARTVLYINGQLFGRVMGFEWTSSTLFKPIYALDNSTPVELLPTQTKTTGMVKVYRVVGDGGPEAAGMTTNYPSINRQKYFSLALVIRDTGNVIFQANQCVLQNQSWNDPVKGFVTGVLNFEAISMDNPEAPEPPA